MDRWNEIEARFEKALALTPEERAAYLDNLETHDPELHREVMSLLAAHEDAPDFFVGLSGTFVAPFLSHLDKEPSAPSHVGPYRVVQELGHGGMSTVYLAERADGQFEQHVALKLVRADVQTDDRLQRFRGERQILASLNHPSVARLLDGGITDDGRPYLVMEYVDGLPINRYCDAHLLSLEDRLRLFQHVVEAVQYAHRNLVVHRDLKPSNILVTEEGKVKLLDFGIAKLLDDEAGSTALTQTGERWMSPEYAAPEQIKGHRITTATDVYQLGVTLYKLLTGHRPYRIATTSTYEIERAVCEAEPTRPSSIVGQVEETRHGTATVRITPESISQTRAADLPVLQRKLSGDLDAIILKALRKEPEHRYASAEAFCEDLKRYLNGLPVLARRGSVGYRARKYVERNRWSIAAIAAIMLLLIGYAVTVTLQAEQIARERDRARLEAFKTEEVNERMIDLFSVSDANEARRDRITAREILEEGTRRVRKELGNQPEVQAEALSVIGRIYERLGFYDESVHLMDSALSIRRQVLRAPHLDLAEGLHHLGTALKNAGHYDQAEQTLREAVRMWNALPAFQKHAAKSMVALGRLLADKNDFATADSLYRATLAIQRALGQEAENDLTKTLSETALLVHNEGDYAAAESLYHETLALQRKLLGENHPDIVTTLVNLAGLYLDRAQFEPADSLYRQALAVERYLFGDEHPEIAKLLNNLGMLHQNAGNLEEAERFLRRALRIKQNLLGEDHPSLAYTYFNLATLLHEQGHYAGAEPLYRRTLAIDQAVYGKEHREVATDLTKLASLLHDRGSLAEAEQLYTQALEIGRRTLPERHPLLANTLVGYGRLLTDLERALQAEALLLEALSIRRETYTDDHWKTAEAKGALGACLGALERYPEAEDILLQSYQFFEATRGRSHYLTQRTLRDLTALYEGWDRPDEANRYRSLLQ